LKARLAPAFGRREVQRTGSVFVDGLLSGVDRKTGWLMAGHAGLARPYRMQSLLGRSQWDADALCDLVRRYVLEALGDPDGVLVVDETGFLKKGEHSVGVARQYSGTAGRIENCQVGVFLAYASRLPGADRPASLSAGRLDARRRPAREDPNPRGDRLPWVPMPSTARIRACGACWKIAVKLMCWPCAPIIPFVFGAGMVWCGPIRKVSPTRCRQTVGPHAPRTRAPKACAFTIGRGSACLGRAVRTGSAGC
jgi:hypothetical protein